MVAPIPGQTKVWQYITLMKRVHLIDCPGVVYNEAGDSQVDTVLKGVVRIERLEDATTYVPDVLARIKPQYIVRPPVYSPCSPIKLVRIERLEDVTRFVPDVLARIKPQHIVRSPVYSPYLFIRIGTHSTLDERPPTSRRPDARASSPTKHGPCILATTTNLLCLSTVCA